MKIFYFILLVFIVQIDFFECKNGKEVVIKDVADIKDFKKILRTKTNILVLFVRSLKENSAVVSVFQNVAAEIKGHGTMVQFDCANAEVKKLCKKLKADPKPYQLKHYHNGEFHKDYDRLIKESSMVNFMRDPTGDIPWEEDETASDVVHVPDSASLAKLIKKESRRTLVMFYAPWCGFCKQMKPDYSQAATLLKDKYVLAAIDVNRPENSAVRKSFNITGFPTLLYFENNKLKGTFEGENNKNGIVTFMEDPTSKPKKEKEVDWADVTSEIVHLSSSNFEPALKDEKSVLVMFYAPWCGHCKRMKPEYEKAAEQMKIENIPGVLAALDATKEPEIAGKFGVKGYPTVKYFSYGEFKFDVNVREIEKIIEFMKNPSEPPPPPPPEKNWDEEETHVVHLDDETFKPFLKKKKHALVMFYAPWCGHCKRTKPEFTKAAEEFKDDPRVEIAAVDCTRFQAVCQQFEVRGYPTIKYFSYLKTVKDYSGGRTAADFVKYLKDPDAPEENKESKDVDTFKEFEGGEKVVILTDANFEETVKKEKGFLIMFYAPWCGHCKNMKPDFATLAKSLDEKQISAKAGAVDCTVNSKIAQKFSIQGYPTIKYFEYGVFKKIYEDNRLSQAMESFIKKNLEAVKDEF